MKIGHISDVHVRSLQYFDEIEFTFQKLYESLQKENVDVIVVAGDVYHNKLTVTNEYFDCCYRFLKGLTDIAPVVLILGNHDFAVDNRNRLDALSPIVASLTNPKHPIYFQKYSGQIKIDDVYFHTLSITDDKKDWPNQDTINEGLLSGVYKEDDIHIALYHGSINGCQFDNDWISRGNKDDIEIFSGFDYALLGDIHKFQMMTDRIAYPGSLRQNNFGEDKDKGYLLWDIESKDEFSVKRIILPQKRYFYTIELDSAENIPADLDIQSDCRIRIKLKNQVNISDDLKIRETIKQLYKPCNDVTTMPPEDQISLEDIQIGDEVISQENLRNPDVQKKLIEDFFKSENLSKDVLESLFRIDEKYNSHLDHGLSRNIIWNPVSMKWKNIFSYGPNNEIDFSKISGITAILGKNMVGKALALETEILTINGWSTIGNIKVGDYVFGPDGKTTKVIAKSPTYKNRECFEVEFSDGEKIVCDAEHLWTVEDHFSRQKEDKVYQTLTTRNLKKLLNWRTESVNKGIGHEWSIDVCKPIEYEKKQLLIHPYVLGCWLGDGTSKSSGFTCGDLPIIENLERFGETINKHDCKDNDTAFLVKKLSPRLRILNVLNNKHIPHEYLQSSIEDRKLLLAGLLDTDGYCAPNGVVEFCNINKILAEQVCELACSLGYKAVFSEGDATLDGRFISKKYRVQFSPTEKVFLLERKNKNIKQEQSGKSGKRFIVDIKECRRRLVQCLVVDNSSHLFLITRKFIATHNSSIIDSLCYSIFNKINKEGAIKNVDYINSKKKKCQVDLEIDFEGTLYSIKRSTIRPNKEDQPADNDVDFSKKVKGKKISLNGETKPDTNKNIRDKFGSLEDFVTTSLCPQEGLTRFLDARGTEKKKIFTKFLDAEIFDEKYQLAEKDANVLKVKIKDYENTDFNSLIKQLENKISSISSSLEDFNISKKDTEKELKFLDDRIIDQSSKVKDIGVNFKNIDAIEKSIIDTENEILSIQTEIKNLQNDIRESEELQNCYESNVEKLYTINTKLSDLKDAEKDLGRLKEEAKLLDRVPCGDDYPDCPFITKAHKAKKDFKNFDQSRLPNKDDLQRKHKDLLDILEKTEDITKKKLKITNLQLQLENSCLKQDNFKKQKRDFESVKNVIEANSEFLQHIQQLKNKKEEILQSVGSVNKTILDLTKELGCKEKELEISLTQKTVVEGNREQYRAYQLYLKAMGKNGISYKIISKRLPIVNQEVNRILSQVTDISVLIEDNFEEKSIRLYILGGGKGKRPVELGSGFEKTIIALALRAALWNISSLPKTPILILDEPFGYIEEDKFGATIRMLKYLKNYFKYIFIISHDKNLKNFADTTIYVSVGDDNFATCSV